MTYFDPPVPEECPQVCALCGADSNPPPTSGVCQSCRRQSDFIDDVEYDGSMRLDWSDVPLDVLANMDSGA